MVKEITSTTLKTPTYNQLSQKAEPVSITKNTPPRARAVAKPDTSLTLVRSPAFYTIYECSLSLPN